MNLGPKKRRWYQLRLRSLLVVMLLAACAVWPVALRVQRLEWQRRQQAALALLSSRLGEPVNVDTVELTLPYGFDPDEYHYLRHLPRLERLALEGRDLDERRLRPLTKLPALKALKIGATLTPAGFAELATLTRLEQLDLRDTPVDAQALEQVARLPRLQALVLETPKDRAAWQHLRQLTQLKSLRIMKGYLLKPGDLQFLAQMPELRLFWLQSSIEGDALADLEHVPLLTELRLQANFLQDRDLQHIAGHTRLRHLTLEANGGGVYTDDGLAVLANFPELSFLNLSHCRHITDRGLVHVRGLTHLRTLRLTGTSITDGGMVHLAGLPKLVNLHVDYTAVTPAGLSQLGPRPALRTLKIGRPEEELGGTLRQQFASAVINGD